MSLIQSTQLNGHNPYAYLKDVLTRLPTQRASEITELLPHRWAPVESRKVCWADAYFHDRFDTAARHALSDGALK
jgi:hypothetical protein